MNQPSRLATAQPAMLVGCAGWSLSSKVASSFPTEGTHLQRYAQVFSCVEINSSFYRSHQPKTYARWAESVPDTFRFSVKMPRTVTHQLRLQQCEVPVRAFFEEVARLESKLGCVLVQLPPSLALDVEDATGFFSLLRDCTQVPIACEPRHASWFTPLGNSVLSEAGIACVQAHPAPVADVEVTCDSALLYIRLHGAPEMYYSAYDDAFIESVAAQMRLAHERNRSVWCIFDNTARGEAVPNALTLIKQLTF
ncbi:DUF72 domain-containing protein [Verticiella sediminum]|uniref:DUF72 domain-containing protein n=1 Tax=Verticiella sediminum TaxID=1247510 RepID=A0A556ACX9_9BURK|nr:DUF72 domain-containing protein [Verticiella sediminum]TSH90737.1 DUF72 domain-containing protein [Verticiella sediminum]